MLSEERKKGICNIVNSEKAVNVKQLMEMFSASEATIRRDLNELDRLGLIAKVHGGAVATQNQVTFDHKVSEREQLNRDSKLRIAEYAASLIKSNDLVYIDAGTTNSFVIDALTCHDAIYVTNAVMHARRLSDRGFTVYITGGHIKATTEAVIGAECINFLEKYNFTIGFFGTNAISLSSGYTTPEPEEARIKECAINHTAKAYILADASKFDLVSSVQFAKYTDATIITTGKIPVAYNGVTNIINL